MDTRLEEYILKIAEVGNMTRAAEQLFITQSALTQQLQKLEQEAGLQMFDRTRNKMMLTEAGKIYCGYARKVLDAKREVMNILHDMSDNMTGTLKIGLTRERGIDLFLNIFPKFYKLYPSTRIMPFELGVAQQHQQLLNGELDMGFIPIAEKDRQPGVDYIPFYTESLLLAVPRTCPLAKEKANAPDEPFAAIDLTCLCDETFVLISQTSSLRTVIDPLFETAGFKPDVLFETASNRTLRDMVAHGLACSIFPYPYATHRDQIAYFYLTGRPTWQINAMFRKGYYLTRAAKSFIALAQDYYYEKCREQ